MRPMSTYPPVIPMLRVFPDGGARAFYVDYLGFQTDWEHHFEPELPLYQQVSRGPWVLHLSEHIGDATPGSAVRFITDDIAALHSELRAKPRVPAVPKIERCDWGDELLVLDPFGNRLIFHQP
ncbi:glyoxalase family protein [Segniliparus rotundus DSM 44985]|uniref:Glyoxalase family protein n=2 Tax=Segniliparus rotundus TaxID=286802 RepID=D6Z9H1_SEGRD|nr:glyoxalase family protein [Segniliparus rotundus DSM 44985]